MKFNQLSLLLCLLFSISHADRYEHNLQVFTANTMEIPCSSAPKELFFGKKDEVIEMSNKEMKSILDNGVSQAGSNVGSWVTANGISGKDLAAGFGAGLIGSFLGTLTKNAVYQAIDDPEFLLISECNTGKSYTRLITMVVSENELPRETAHSLARQDQNKMARKVSR